MVGSTRLVLAGLLAVLAAAAAPAAAPAGTAVPPVRVSVVATDTGLALSRAKVPAGTVVFRVRNAGTRPHAFEIGGKATRTLSPGARATLRVRLGKPGRVPYASRVAGKAEAALAGVLRVERVTTVQVDEFEFGFRLSQDTVRPGKVVFVMRNTGAIVHNFDVIDVKVGEFLVSGQSATMTVNLKRGSYTYVCSVKYHAAQGMQGTLTVR